MASVLEVHGGAIHGMASAPVEMLRRTVWLLRLPLDDVPDPDLQGAMSSK
jgi:hypothetical protein